MGVLGCDLSAAETGACSAIPAGEAETQIQSGSGWFAGSGLRKGLSGDQFGVSGCDSRSELFCTVGTANGQVFLVVATKVNLFYNGLRHNLAPSKATATLAATVVD